MRVGVKLLTRNQYGAGLRAPFEYFHDYLSDAWADIPFGELEIVFAYPPKSYSKDDTFMKWYSDLPFVKFYKKRSCFTITVTFEKLRNLDMLPLNTLFDKLYEVIDILDAKYKNREAFIAMRQKLSKVQDLLSIEKLREMNKEYEKRARQNLLEKILKDREARASAKIEPNKLIRDIRFYYHLDGVGHQYFTPYSDMLTGLILRRLRELKFKLPNYTHLYISVADSYENALSHAGATEKWFVYGFAALANAHEYAAKSEQEKKRIVFNLIKEGLLDIAKSDKLNISILEAALNEVEERYIR
ncbi:MAG: hypothetical protein LBQ18_02020 [Campylobacteraceae bacterium]|nr:hypothetical protein [Campylobacteraceae bacterium]